ncbi:hypothetical protein HMPREF1129_0581 [Actinomyces naeslundii str. Howell 279]|uniref:Uncharacterized protein n=1 Tax=Actinomyces naeslundii (strain ATCC 12104 / DSM 43013 / CCUG 2238 / JCM 8349 / NCTC 10301 / Howell 279) TaxID=1115803 RepID=J2ZR11_ACTNH|nr:hypothetical protein HMPREF1129_0581 [Actinomyces naeslundii str. Howell 279]
MRTASHQAIPAWVFVGEHATVLELSTSKMIGGGAYRYRRSMTMQTSWGPGPNRG